MKKSKGKSKTTPASERAKGVRIPTGDHHVVAMGTKEPDNLAPSTKKLLARITKAGQKGVSVASVSGDAYTRWLLRCLLKARLVRLAERKQKPSKKVKAAHPSAIIEMGGAVTAPGREA